MVTAPFELRHGIVDKKIAIRSAKRVQQFCRLCHTHHSLLPALCSRRSNSLGSSPEFLARVFPPWHSEARRSRALHRGKL
jgi:hypothetical protein